MSGVELAQSRCGHTSEDSPCERQGNRGGKSFVQHRPHGRDARLNLQAAGLKADERGRLKVNEHYQTEVPHVYAAGDVIGFPSLASTSLEQGRLAACHAFGVEAKSTPELFPYGIYTIPEISYVGKNEEELTQANVPYEMGKASYREIARGQIIGDNIGMLKLLFDRRPAHCSACISSAKAPASWSISVRR